MALPETALVSTGRRGGSAAVSAAAAERTISEVDSTSVWAQPRHSEEMADERFISHFPQRDCKRPMTAAFTVVV